MPDSTASSFALMTRRRGTPARSGAGRRRSRSRPKRTRHVLTNCLVVGFREPQQKPARARPPHLEPDHRPPLVPTGSEAVRSIAREEALELRAAALDGDTRLLGEGHHTLLRAASRIASRAPEEGLGDVLERSSFLSSSRASERRSRVRGIRSRNVRAQWRQRWRC